MLNNLSRCVDLYVMAQLVHHMSNLFEITSLKYDIARIFCFILSPVAYSAADSSLIG
jgi:hypothetical protein